MRHVKTILAAAMACIPCVATCAKASWSQLPSGNLPITDSPGTKDGLVSVEDGVGGVILVWVDRRLGGDDLYAQRMSAAGDILWAHNGLPVCAWAGDQRSPAVVSDGVGGAIIVWEDLRSGGRDIYAQRLDANGANLWASGGLPVETGAGDQHMSPGSVAQDGAGGVVVAWRQSATVPAQYVAQRLSAAGAKLWGSAGVTVVSSFGVSSQMVVSSDGQGGAVVGWMEFPALNHVVRAQRVLASGVVQWTPAGVQVCGPSPSLWNLRAASLGSHGTMYVYEDGRTGSTHVHVQIVRLNGSVPLPAVGLRVGPRIASPHALSPEAIPDGAGGAFVTWFDGAPAGWETPQVARVTSSGGVAWSKPGCPLLQGGLRNSALTPGEDSRVLLATAGQFSAPTLRYGVHGRGLEWRTDDWYAMFGGSYLALQDSLAVGVRAISTLGGGAIVAWIVKPGSSGDDQILANRMDAFGRIEDLTPVLTSVRDVPSDQGGRLRVQWQRNSTGSIGGFIHESYRVWRSVGDAAAFSTTGPRRMTSDAAEAVRSGLWWTQDGLAWEPVGFVYGTGAFAYSLDIPTFSDSMPSGGPATHVRVQGVYYGGQNWFSAADSARSVDNLPPDAPPGLVGDYLPGRVELLWSPSPEPDFAYYEVHRSSVPLFDPVPGNRIAEVVEPSWTDITPLVEHYKVVAVDIHGNRGRPSVLIVPGTLGGVDQPPTAMTLDAPDPNPARHAMRVSFTLPRSGHVELGLVDVTGRVVRNWPVGIRAVGRHHESFQLRGSGTGWLPGGMYWLRLQCGEEVLTRRFAVVR